MTVKRIPAPDELLAQEQAPSRARVPSLAGTRRDRHRALNASDGTDQMLVSGFWTLLVGMTAALLAIFVFGGFGPQGAHSNPGWLSLMVAMMSTPFAILLLLLGGAKWLRNLRLSKDAPRL